MGKQRKVPQKPENIGSGKVTPVQIAFIVDRYLSDNAFSETRSIFRTEASSLISTSPVHEAPKSLLSLGAILDEYICLKEQKVMVDQEKARLEQEKLRVRTLLQGMQNVMNVYNSSGADVPPPLPAIPTSAADVQPIFTASPLAPSTGSPPAGYSVYKTPVATSVSMPPSAQIEVRNYTTPVTTCPSANKRKCLRVTDPLQAGKRPRRRGNPQPLPNEVAAINTFPQSSKGDNNQQAVEEAAQSSPHNRVPNGSLLHSSSVAKSLFSQPKMTHSTTSSGPKTPPRMSFSQSDKSISPEEFYSDNSSEKHTLHGAVSTNSNVIALETHNLEISPSKRIAHFSSSKSHCIISLSPAKTDLKRVTKRDHVKGRLDFDGSESVDAPITSERLTTDGISASESEKDTGIFDIDLPDLDAFGADFSELFAEFDIDCEAVNLPSKPSLASSIDSMTKSPAESRDDGTATNMVLSELSSTVTEVLSEKDMNIQGQDVRTSVKSTTQCIKILSPAKTSRSSAQDQENLCTDNRLI